MRDHGVNQPSDTANMRATDVRSQVVLQDTDNGPNRRERIRNKALAVAGVILVGLAAVTLIAPESDESDSAAIAAAEAEGNCPNSWEVVQLSNDNSRVIGGGVSSIGDADTNDEARAASLDWFNLIKHDPEALAGNANTFNAAMGRSTSYKADELYDGTCFTAPGEQAATELKSAIGLAHIAPAEAPRNGFNTGVDANGNIVVAAHAGITGNRKAVEMTLPTGKKIWVMERCGNVVTVGDKPPVPEGPTDEPDKPKPTTSTVPVPTTTSTTTIPAKVDDGKLPGNQAVPADQDKGTPDKAGIGPVGQIPNEDGYLPTETAPNVPSTTTTTHPQTSPTTYRPTATTGVTTATTGPPQTATTTVSTTAPQSGTLPPRP